MLAGLMAPFVTDRESQSESLEQLSLKNPELGQAFAKMVSALHPLRRRLRQSGFAANPYPSGQRRPFTSGLQS